MHGIAYLLGVVTQCKDTNLHLYADRVGFSAEGVWLFSQITYTEVNHDHKRE